MNPSAIILGATVAGLVANTLAVLALVWRGGRLLGRLEGSMENLSEQLARIVSQVDALESRVGHLEGRRG